MSSQNSNTKTLFKSAVKNTGKFLNGLFRDTSEDVMGPNPHTDSGESKVSRRIPSGISKFICERWNKSINVPQIQDKHIKII